MTLVFYIPPVLRQFSAGQANVSCDAPPQPVTVATALARLFTLHPGLRDRVTDERGAVRQHVNVFVGAESIRFSGGLATPLPDVTSVEISIVPAISGGSGEEDAAWA